MDKVKEYTKLIFKSLINPKNKLSLIPNWLSFTRAIGGITMPIMAYTGASPIALVSLLSVLAISDFLDGKAARYIAKQESQEGALLDAISDKIFSLCLIAGIIAISPIFIINGLLEGAIAIINTKSFEDGDKPKSNLIGKIKIWPLSAALILGYLSHSMGDTNYFGISSNLVNYISIGLSLTTIPLETINIKQYYNLAKEKRLKNIVTKIKDLEKQNTEKQKETENKKVEEKTLKKSNNKLTSVKTKTHYKLSTSSNKLLIINNDELNPIKEKNKQKRKER